MLIFFKNTVRLLILCTILLFLTACSGRFPVFHQLGPLPADGICRVAVLPFVNATDFRDGGTIFYRVFTAELAERSDFQLVQEGDVRNAFRQARLIPGFQEPNFEKLRIIGNYLNADVLIAGSIIEMKEDEATPSMTVNLYIIDAYSGNRIWNTYHKRVGEEYRKVMHFGMVYTYTRLSRKIAEEILDRWISKGFIAKCHN